MANIIIRPGWALAESASTSKEDFLGRRDFIRRLGLGSIGLLSAPSALSACTSEGSAPAPEGPLDMIPADAPRFGLPASRNGRYTVAERQITDRVVASSHNNFYEFDGSSKTIWPLTKDYDPFPWTIEVGGLVEKRARFDIEALIREFGLEERVYRFRCVEAWAMTVPWTGFPLKKLIDKCRPTSKARYVAFTSANRPRQMPGIPKQRWYPWPYYEGLRLDEATNDLAFVATGMYGEPIPKQNGSPLRLVLPWKYGYKGPKAVVKLTFVDEQPPTFWNDLQPLEYSFFSNVNPNVPHPRWSQASERLIGEERRVASQLFNGYGEWVGSLYPNEPRG